MAIPDIREFQEIRAGLLDDEYPPVQVSVNTVGASVWTNGRNRPIVLTNEGQIVATNAGLTPPVGTARISAVTSTETDDITDKISVGVARYDSRRQLYSNLVVVGIDQYLADPESGGYVSWLYDSAYNEDVADGVYPSIDFLNSPENKGGFTLSGLETLLGDHETDQYDQIAVLIYSWTSGEWFAVRFIDVADIQSYGYGYGEESVTITAFRAGGGDEDQGLNFFPLYTPNQSYVFPAVRSLRTMTIGGQQRLVGAHMAGFDCFTDMPPLFKGRSVVRLDENSVLTLNVPASGAEAFAAFRDGTHIIIGYDANGDEIVRGFIGPATDSEGDYYYYQSQTVSDVDGTVLEYNQIQICRTFERNSLYTQDGDINDGEQTWVIRRQIVAYAENGSREVKLYHDTDLTIPAQFARQYWVHALATIQGLGTGFVDKVHTVDGTWYGSLDDGTEIGDGLMLREAWDWPTGSGFFSVEGRSRVVFVGRSDRNTFDTTGLGFEIPTLSRTSIMAIEYLRGDLLVLTQIGQAYTLNPNPFADPATFELAVTFDVREAVPDRSLHYNGTCVSNQTWVYQNGAVGWIGSEGPWALDGSAFVLLSDQEISTLWGRVPKKVLAGANCAVNQSHKSGAVIHFGGMRQSLDGKNDFQLALHLERGHWLDYTGSAVIDSCASALMENGGQRVIFGGMGRIWRYGDKFHPLYGFPHVHGTRFGTVRSLRDVSGQAILETESGEFVRWGSGRYWDRAGIRVAIVDDLGNVQTAEVLRVQPTGELLVLPDAGSPWLMDAGRTYRFIIGPRHWAIELPWRTATGGATGVEAEMFQFDATDTSRFDWTMAFTLEGSRTTPNLDDAEAGALEKKKIDRKRFLRSRFLQQNNAVRMATGPDHRLRLTFEGIHPPDSHLTIRRILLGLRYHGRL